MDETLDNSSASAARPEDTIKILIATDNHLGYQESDPIIGNDSFIAFEEILDLAVKNKVDMILLGGDLFHDNNPSQQTMNRCMALLRKYTMGSQPVYLQLLCSAPITRCEGSAPANYLDENLNISIPVFSIHGNHDDPSGVGLCSAMDTLSSAGLVNYFGKWTDFSNIEVRPILLQKGETLLALYGLSHIKDDRLCRLFLEEKVTMVRPKETPGDWFNIFVIHQNRVDRGPKRFISDSYLPGFLDFVIWGHEHDCNIIPEKNLDKGFYVTQPGSSVPTSLAEGETLPKHVGLLEVCKRKFRFTALKLKTVRPFLFGHMALMNVPTTSSVRDVKSEQIRDACKKRVEEMIHAAKKLRTGHPMQPKLPLIRLRCEFTDDTQLFNLVKFGQMFYKRVANPDTEVIRLKKICQQRSRQDDDARADIENLREMQQEETFSACVELFVEEYFAERADTKLAVLSIKGMASAVERFLVKGDSKAIEKVCKHQREATFKKMMQLDIDDDNVLENLMMLRDQRLNNVQEEEEELRDILETGAEGNSQEEQNNSADSEDDENGESEDVIKTPARKQTIPAMFQANRSNDDDENKDVPAVARGRGRGRGRPRSTSRARGARGKVVTPNKAPLFASVSSRSTRSTQNNTSTSAMRYEDDSD